MLNFKMLIAVLIIFMAGYIVLSSSDDEKMSLKGDKSNFKTTQVENIKSYKDVFKQEKIVNTLEKMQDAKDLDEITKESQKLIAKADLLIQENNLIPLAKDLFVEDKEKITELDNALKKVQQELEELSHEG
jgi:hypothetical protein